MTSKISRLLISSFQSGSGKTTFTMGLLRLMQRKGIEVSSYKCGPDYIDTMFHSKALNMVSRNLDLFLSNERTVKNIISSGKGIAVIEGAMGFYDGISFTEEASAYDISRVTNTPVILIVDIKGRANTVNALIKGMLEYRKNNIRAVILNRVNELSFLKYKEMIERELSVLVAGYIPEMKGCELESRHLGLVTAEEMDSINEIIDNISYTLEKTIDLDLLLSIASSAYDLEYDKIEIDRKYSCRIGIASDKAFCFHYADNLRVLRDLGAELVYFSPVADKSVSDDLDGLIFYGGYPELYKKELSSNIQFIGSLRELYKKGIPLIAECGGYMYISNSIDEVGMVSLLDCNSYMKNRLQNFGYVFVKSRKDSMLLKKDELIQAHEFHYSVMDNESNDCEIIKAKGVKKWEGVYLSDHVYAGYPHLYFLSNIEIAERFLRKAEEYRNRLSGK